MVAPAQSPGSAPQIVRPIVLIVFRNGTDMPLGPDGKVQRAHLHNAGALGPVGHVDSLIHRHARDFSQIMVGMGADGAYPVRAKCNAIGAFSVNIL